jgi:oxygen-independent coproporphyrinogen-3 oxidase
VAGDKINPDSALFEEYVKGLCAEIARVKNPQNRLQTVFFGGGTPSLLPVRFLERIFHTLESTIGIETGAEISIEIDPGTFTLEQLRAYKTLGVNRFSLGVQAFQNELLHLCGRSHRSDDIFRSIDLLHQAEITNWSLDLISGLPQQSLPQWQESLQSAIALSPAHLSCYDLVVESVTPFGKQYQPGVKPLPDDETTAAMYRLASSYLTAAGYEHYEISNYARFGHQCKHNRVYWENSEYYGFGMGAASYLNRQRFTRPRTRQQYYEWVAAGCLIDSTPSSPLDLLLETLMLGLRLKEGVNLNLLEQEFGPNIQETITNSTAIYFDKNWIKIDQSNRFSLTDPEGFLFSNTILTRLFETIQKQYPNL